ncbi:MAG: hypothetical protein ACMXYF_02190 [Candidatus Woesearchaeota archaeon]
MNPFKTSLKEKHAYLRPLSQTHSQYFEKLLSFNDFYLRSIKTLFQGLDTDFAKENAIVVVGSDARREKGGVSPFEIEIVSENLLSGSCLESHLRDFSQKTLTEELFDSIRAIKVPGTEPMYVTRFKRGEAGQFKYYATSRILDARFVWGNMHLSDSLKEYFLTELQDATLKRKIYRRTQERWKYHQTTTKTGVSHFKGKKIKQFDTESGIAYYDGNYENGFKQGPLRAVQFALGRDLVDFFRNSDRPILGKKVFLESLSYNTVNRLFDLDVEGLLTLTDTELDELTDSYKFFLWAYHSSQVNFSENGLKETPFDSNEVKQRLSLVSRLTKKRLIK